MSEQLTVAEMQTHQLSDTWTCWVHLPNDNNWEISGYKQIDTFCQDNACLSR